MRGVHLPLYPVASAGGAPHPQHGEPHPRGHLGGPHPAQGDPRGVLLARDPRQGLGIQAEDPGGGDQGSKTIPTYCGIASINKSVRDNKNILEVRLERSENAKFSLSRIETEGLLMKLGIYSNHFLGVSCCPEGKGVVYIILHPYQ